MGVVLIIAIAIGVFAFQSRDKSQADGETGTETAAEILETELQKEVVVNIVYGTPRQATGETTAEGETLGLVTSEPVTITGLSREEAREKLLEHYPWDMKVTWNDQTFEVANLMEGKIDTLLNEIYQGSAKDSYDLDTSGLEEAVAAEVTVVAAQWDKNPKNASISSFDKSAGKWVFTAEENGQKVNQEQLKTDILAALTADDFDAVIAAQVDTVAPEITEASAREQYKTVSTYSTKTTANSKRNTNIRLSCEAIDGTVLQPGEEFSFNDRVGQRTEAKGYQAATAYSNGETVQEIGGGICQTSTTLYNAVLRAGLKTTVRRSHTYEPSYVTPGLDATVSWGGPDYAFVNNSDTGIGIRASYSDQTVTISIYAIPILEDGVKYDLKSTKIKETDPPAPTYVEDQSVQPGTEEVKSAGSNGSQWEVRLVVTKDGEVISSEVDHTSTYKGHAPVIKRNTSGVWIPPADASTEASSTVAPVESSSDGLIPSVDVSTEAETTASSGEMGPGIGLPAPGSSGGPGVDGTSPGGSGSPGSTTAAPGSSGGPGTITQPGGSGSNAPAAGGPGTVQPNSAAAVPGM